MHHRRPRFSLLVAILPLLFACASPEESNEDALTPEAELPEAYSRSWRAWYEESEEWLQLREGVQRDPQLASFIVDNLLRVMVRFYDHGALAARGELPGPFERAQHELVFLAPHSAPVCIELAIVGDGPVSFLAGDVLERIDDSRWTLPVALRLRDEEVATRRRSAALLEKLPPAREEEEDVWDLLEEVALEDTDWSVRAQAVGTVGVRAGRVGDLTRPRRILCRALGDSDPTVVQAACRGIATTRDSRTVPAVINLLERLGREGENLATEREVQRCLRSLTGETAQHDAAGWRRWWKENHP
jgi:hypothetical protein